MAKTVKEPQGIGFFSVKTGDTHYLKNEPGIAAYINSSDMGINASRGQDFGWRLDPAWVKRVRDFRRDRTQMQILAAANNGQKPTTVQILHYLYGEDLRNYQEELEENENPFEGQYRKEISDQSDAPKAASPAPIPLPEGEGSIPNVVDDKDLAPSEDDEEIDPDAAAEAATSDPDDEGEDEPTSIPNE